MEFVFLSVVHSIFLNQMQLFTQFARGNAGLEMSHIGIRNAAGLFRYDDRESIALLAYSQRSSVPRAVFFID